jgi:signal transduction histidine kinase
LLVKGAPLNEVLAVGVAEVARRLGAASAAIERYEGGSELTVLAAAGEDARIAGDRQPLEPGSLATTVLRTGRPSSLAPTVAAPIIVHDEIWGLVSARAAPEGALPATTEIRLAGLAELMAMAIANVRTRDELGRVAEEHGALRRIAMLVAEGMSTDRLFAAVCAEAGRVLAVPAVSMERYDADGHTTVLATWGDVEAWEQAGFSVGSRWPLDGTSIALTVFDTGRPATTADYPGLLGTIAPKAQAVPRAAMAGVPITVEGRTWGVIAACTSEAGTRELPTGIESSLSRFSDLVAIAVASAHARNELRRLADEQAALRRVATVAAEDPNPESVFAAVCEEAGRLLRVPGVFVERVDPDGFMTILATWGDTEVWTEAGLEVGTRWPLDGPSVTRMVLDTGRFAMITNYSELPGGIAAMVRAAPGASMAAVPIMVEGEIWGVLIVCTDGSSARHLPTYIELQLTRFTELIATAVSNAQARSELRSLAEEQAALRRIATLVARGAEEPLVFAGVCAETGGLVNAGSVNLVRFMPDGSGVAVAGWSLRDTHVPTGTRLPLEDDSVSGVVWRTARAARMDSYEHATGELARLVRSRGTRSSLGVPVVVEGRLWGVLIPGRDWDETFRPGTEQQVARFAELTATSISNATTRSELIASRARLVAAGDEARRRIERNLHDGIQQRLIVLSLDVESVRETVRPEDREAHMGLDQLSRELEDVQDDLRQLSQGLHPAILSRHGLSPALAAVVRTSRIPATLQADIEKRQPPATEIAVYYVVSEALTNAGKHSRASEIHVSVVASNDAVLATIADNGIGGADRAGGSGLIGLTDRVAALGGSLELESPPGGGTTISVVIPIRAEER